MKTFKLWSGLILALIVLGGGAYLYWNVEVRYRPKTITKHQAEIAKLLEHSGWVSNGGTRGKLYMVSFRSCPDCIRFEAEEFPGLHAAGVDTREILVARRDYDGVSKSTPAERSTVAELWVNRRWSLLEQWTSVPVDAWKAPGIIPADGDIAREAVVEAGRKTVDDLKPLLKDNGVTFAYPLLIWWTTDGQMHGCACEKRQTYRFVRKELGA
jgi:hypothetical protein